jgi:hypothetical protein
VAFSFPDFFDELVEGCRPRQVEDGVRLQRMTVSAGDERQIEKRRELEYGAVFFPGPQAVQLERVKVYKMSFRETTCRVTMSLRSDSTLVPIGVIENDQC